jgi:glucose-1-phosphate thymidylyltransferase
MIYFPIQTLIGAGITDIMIVSGKGHAGQFLEHLRSGHDFGARFTYGVQEKAGGIAEALALCEDFVGQDKVVVMLGDNILEDSITKAVQDFEHLTFGAMVFLKQVDHPQSFGVPVFSNGRIIDIEEKPEVPRSSFAVVGVYCYDASVWQVLKTLKPSGRGELEITDVNNHYVHQGSMTHQVLEGWWGDGGESFDSLLEAANLVATKKRQVVKT